MKQTAMFKLFVTPRFNSFMPVGETIVTCTAVDSSGNETVETFTVLIIGDPQPLESKIIPKIQMPPLP